MRSGAMPREENTAVANVGQSPFGRLGEEGEGEVGGSCESASRRCGAVRRHDGVETQIATRPAWKESKDGWAVERPEAAAESAVGDSAVERSARGGGTDDVSRIVDAEEVLLQEINGEV